MSKNSLTLHDGSVVVGYIRTSTALQADKVSPELQRKDIQDYCDLKGYDLIGFYEDIEKYKVGSRMVEPSSRRSDRPQWLKMLSDGRDGKFHGIIGWRNDRLYRGVTKALLALSELITENNIVVELVKETFDISYAPVIAWATGLELEAKHDRLVMGMTGRFQKNKIWIANAPYGYDYIKESAEKESRGEPNGVLVINKEERKWIQKIWQWYADEISLKEIRRRLIEAGVKQKGVRPRKHVWHTSIIQNILRYKTYYTGKYIINYDGERYEIDVPKIIEENLAFRVVKRKRSYKSYPKGRTKYPNLLGGLVFCDACNVRMHVVSQKNTNKHGKKTLYMYYRCNNGFAGIESDKCAKTISVKKLDKLVWDRLWNLFSKPDEFKKAVERVTNELNNSKSDAVADKDRFENRLISLEDERNWVIAQGRRLQWSDKELDQQLAPVELEINNIRKELQSIQIVLDNKADKVSNLANLFSEQVRIGYNFLNKNPNNSQEELIQYEAKKKLVRAFVSGVYVKQNKTFEIYTEFDLGNTFEDLGFIPISASNHLSDILKIFIQI